MIFIGYRRQIGRDDIEDITEFLEKHTEFNEVYILFKESLTDIVKLLGEKHNYKFVQTDRLKTVLKELQKNHKSKAYFLDDFGKRKLRNPCGRSLSKPQYW